jgi:hypothetical protein
VALAWGLVSAPASALTLQDTLARARTESPRLAAIAASDLAARAEARADAAVPAALRAGHDPDLVSVAIALPTAPGLGARRAAVRARAAAADARAAAARGGLLVDVVDAWVDLACAQARAARVARVAPPRSPDGELSEVEAALLGAVATTNARDARDAARAQADAAARLGALLGGAPVDGADGPWDLPPPPAAAEALAARVARTDAEAAAQVARATPGVLGTSEISLGVGRSAEGPVGAVVNLELPLGGGASARAGAAVARADAAARARVETTAAADAELRRAEREGTDAEALLADIDAERLAEALRAVDAGLSAGELSVAEYLVQRRAVQDALETVDALRAMRVRARAAQWAAAGAWPGGPGGGE